MGNKAMNTAVLQNDTKKRVYTASESAFAWLSILIGYLFCRVYPATENPTGAFLFTVFLFCVTAVVMAFNNASFGGISLVTATSALIFAFSIIFTENSFIHFFAYLYCMSAYGLFIYTAYRNHNSKSFAFVFPLDFFKALFLSPFQSISNLGKGLMSNNKINMRPILKIVLGAALATIPTILVVLLLSYDSGFRELTNKIFDFEIEKMFSHIGSFILGLPIGMYIYGMFISAVDKKSRNLCPEDKVRKTVMSMKFVPRITVIVSVIPIIAVYTLFFVSQWKYYISGFVGVLPDEYSYAEYARQGFFQLCIVSVINFIIISMIGIFMRRKTEKPSIAQRILSVTMSVASLILITTALAKMVMYIDIYGLTPKRVYATWFMLVLAVVFILVILKQFAIKLPLILLSSCVVALMFTILVFAQTDKIIAEYNVDRYIEGSLDDVDTPMLKELGDAAIPSLVRVLHKWDEEYGYDYRHYLSDGYTGKGDWSKSLEFNNYINLCNVLKEMAMERHNTFWNYTLLQKEADRALSEIGLDNITEETEIH